MSEAAITLSAIVVYALFPDVSRVRFTLTMTVIAATYYAARTFLFAHHGIN